MNRAFQGYRLFFILLFFFMSGAVSTAQAGASLLLSPQAESVIYLPFVLKNLPSALAAPVLDAISNADGDGSYSLNWSASAGASTYTLQEDDNAYFSSPLSVYVGAGISTALGGRGIGTYYYRVQASTAPISSDWSNTESVVVTVLPPDCPQTRIWTGVTSQNYGISFEIETSPQCQIVYGTLKATYKADCDTTIRTVTMMVSPAIIDDHFDTGEVAGHQVDGHFTSDVLANGTFDFNPTVECSASGTWSATVNGTNAAVDALLVQPDGKILLSGRFTALGGQAYNAIGRLNADGTLDTSFNPGLGGENAYTLARQADGKILVGGTFTEWAGQPRERIARLNADGTLDTTFNPGAGGTLWAMRVDALAVQADGKILVGGNFDTLGGGACPYLGRLNVDGTLDTTFNPVPDGRVYALALQKDGKILVAGAFETLDGQARPDIGRLNTDGSRDETFNPDTTSIVDELALQPDGKILIGGGVSYLARLNADGTLDTGFTPPWESNTDVLSLALQPDGKILVGGWISTSEGAIKLGRLNANGSLDAAFTPVVSGGQPYPYVFALALQADDKILVGGIFTYVDGVLRMNFARLNPDGTPAATLP